MSAIENYYYHNIREYFPDGCIRDMEALNNFISSFSCPLNPMELVGYFTVTIKPLSISADKLSNSLKKKIERTSRFNPATQTYNTAAYLIAQLGKNYTDAADTKISGGDLLKLVFELLHNIQHDVGGVIAFAEAEDNEKLLNFYSQNYFVPSDKRVDDDGMTLVQLLRIIR